MVQLNGVVLTIQAPPKLCLFAWRLCLRASIQVQVPSQNLGMFLQNLRQDHHIYIDLVMFTEIGLVCIFLLFARSCALFPSLLQQGWGAETKHIRHARINHLCLGCCATFWKDVKSTRRFRWQKMDLLIEQAVRWSVIMQHASWWIYIYTYLLVHTKNNQTHTQTQTLQSFPCPCLPSLWHRGLYSIRRAVFTSRSKYTCRAQVKTTWKDDDFRGLYTSMYRTRR